MRLTRPSLLLLTGILGCADVLGLDAYGTGGAGGSSPGGAGGTGTTSTAGTGGTGASTTTTTTDTGGATSTGGGGAGGATTSTGGGGAGGATTSSSTTSTSTATTCAEGDTEPCYTGPPETEGIGACKPGVSTCDADGTWGACVGETVPQRESCNTADIDESCDQLAACTGQLRWVRHFPAPEVQQTQALAVDPGDDHVVAVGYSEAAIDFGGGVLPFVDKKDAFIVRLDAAGKHVWSKAFGGGGNQRAEGLAIDANGDLFVTGSFASTMTVDGGDLMSGGGDDVFVLKLDRKGNVLWKQSFGGAGAQRAHGVAVDASGNVCIVGEYGTAFSIGASAFAVPLVLDVFVACLAAASGDPIWAKAFTGADQQDGRAITFDPAGELYVAADVAGAINFGGGALTSAGSTDIAIAKLSKTNGAHLWSQRYGDAALQTVNSLTGAGDSGVVFGASVQGTFPFGSVMTTGDGSYDAAVVKLAPTGATVWARRVGAAATSQYTWGVTADPQGFVLAAGVFGGSLDFSGDQSGLLSAVTPLDRWVARLGPAAGVSWWTRGYPNASDGITWLGVDHLGRIDFTGNFQGTTDFGSGPLSTTGTGDLDVVIGQLAP